MPSPADALMLSGNAAFGAIHADTWRILGPGASPPVGTTFEADAQTEAPMVLDTDLGSDAREKTMLYVDRPAPAIAPNMILEGKGSQWRVVGGVDDNPANYRVKFEVIKIISGKDSL